ncbi:MAG: hypothetical protein ACOX12_07415 [Eggerthellaceae bacterium]|jgi:hypothetical protein
MKYQALYESDGNAALKVDVPRYSNENEHIIPFPGNPKAASNAAVSPHDLLRDDYRSQESVTVEAIPFGTDYIESRHLFYWMTDETAAELRAKHAPKLSPLQRKAYYYADRTRNALVNHPFAEQLKHGTLAGRQTVKLSGAQYLRMFLVGLLFATATALVGA